MSHPSYAAGYRHEKRVQAWLVHLGECVRSFMSRKPDLTLTYSLRKWRVSCKWKSKGYKAFYDELEENDILAIGAARQMPIICMLAPKFIEMMGKAEAQDFAELNGDAA